MTNLHNIINNPVKAPRVLELNFCIFVNINISGTTGFIRFYLTRKEYFISLHESFVLYDEKKRY